MQRYYAVADDTLHPEVRQALALALGTDQGWALDPIDQVSMWSPHIHMYVHIYTHTHTHMHMHTHTHVHVHIHVHTHMYATHTQCG